MILSKKLTSILVLTMILVFAGSLVWAQSGSVTVQPLPFLPPGVQQSGSASTGTPSLQQMTPQQTDAYQKLSPAQRGAVDAEIGKSGGRLTPEAIETLKGRPEFKGLSPEDVAKGKQLLEQRNKATKESPETKTRSDEKKQIIGQDIKDRSLFDRSRSIGKYQDISINLLPFGFDFFGQAAVQIATERKDIPVPMKYIIGPGDEVKLLLWGRVNAQYNLVVDRDGKITVPQIGPLFVAGMTFEDMSKQVIKQSEQIVGTNVDISMGSLKTIPVFVLGDVRRPGAYTIGSFATITDALLMAGGPTEIGTMRHIQLKRKGQLVTTFDLYDLLLKGDKTKDLTLLAGDVVFVPVTGPLVGIAGNVRRPAIYELRNRSDLENAIDLAGGVIPTAYTQQIQVERIIRNERQVVLDINDKTLEKAATIKLQDADLVKVFSIVDTNVNAVYLSGNVKRPGKYEIKPGMKLLDLLKDSTELLAETHFDYALIKRLNPPGMETTLIPFDLGGLLLKKDPAHNIELKPQDQIFIFSRWFFKDKPTVSIEGEIRGDCHALHGGKTDPQYADPASIPTELKAMEDDLKKQGLFDLSNMLRDLGNEARTKGRIQPDNLRVLRAELIEAKQNDFASRISSLENRIKNICQIDMLENMRVKDAILIAGGLTNDSYLEKGEIIRKDVNSKYRTLYFNVSKAMSGQAQDNPVLEKEDRIIIHSVWEHVYKTNVSIDGEVAKPGSYQYTEGITVRDLVFKGGNILESAYVEEAEISSIYTEGRKALKTERKVINLKRALDGDPVHNIRLLPNDRLLVKRIPDWGVMKYVTLSGEFRFPGRYAIQKGERLSSVIERAGGYSSYAYLRGSFFARDTVRQIQQKSLEEMAQRMERELLSESSARIASSLTADEMQSKRAEVETKQKLISYMRQIKATGRMTIVLTHVRMLKGSPYDIELEEGDTLYLPKKNNVVNIVGAVMSEGSHLYNDDLTYKDYIGMTGGYARYADESNTFVLKADGSARKLSKGFMEWSDRNERWEMTAFGQKTKPIEPGDVIVVPEKISQIAWLREIRDITQILMNVAVTAGVIIKLF